VQDDFLVQDWAAAPGAVPTLPVPTALTGEAFDAVAGEADPFAAAVAGWSILNPAAAAQTRARIAAIATEIGDALEDARLHASTGLPGYLQRQATFVRRRTVLENRLQLLEGPSSLSPRPTIEAEVYGLVTSVQRWRAAQELRLARSTILGALKANLREAQSQVRGLVDAYPSGQAFVVSAEQVKTGLISREDAWVRRMAEALATRRHFSRRVAFHDAQGDAGRAVQLQETIAKAGLDVGIVALLQPGMPAPSTVTLRAARAETGKLEEAIRSTDPETRRAGELQAQLAKALTRQDALVATIADEQAAAAGQLVNRALGGSLEAIAELEGAVAPFRPSLAAAIAQVRGNEDDLIRTVGELISLQPPNQPH